MPRFHAERSPAPANPAALIVRAIQLLTGDPRTGAAARPDEAVDLLRRAVEHVPPGHPLRPVALSSLGMALHNRFRIDGDRAALDEAVEIGRAAVDSAPPGHPARGTVLGTFGLSLHARAVRTGDPAELDEAITACRTAVPLLAAGDPARAATLFAVATGLLTRFERTGDTGDLDPAVDAARAAAQATVAGHPDRGLRLNTLADLLRRRSRRTDHGDDLDEVIATARSALAPGGRDPLRNRLREALRERFRRTADLADLDGAVETGRDLLRTTPPGPDRLEVLFDLGNDLRVRFDHTGDATDLDAAVAVGREAVAAAAVDSPEYRVLAVNLTGFLTARFEYAGVPADLDEATALGRAVVAAIPTDDPVRATGLTNLGLVLRSRYERFGDGADLEEAIALTRAAVDAGPPDDADRGLRLANLGAALGTGFTHTGRQADLDEAITVTRQAIEAAPPDDPDRPPRLANLGRALRSRFQRTGDRSDIDEAVEVGRAAAATLPAGRPEHPNVLSSLSSAFLARSGYSDTGTQGRADVDDAITAATAAVTASGVGDPFRAMYLSNLATAHQRRFRFTGDPDSLDAAITTGRAAVAASPADGPTHATHLINLSQALQERFEERQSQGDADEAVAAGRAAHGGSGTPPHLRAAGARAWGRAAATAHRWDDAVAGYTAACALLGLVAPRRLARGDQEHQIADLSGLGPEAATCCVHAGMVDRALELLEQGRGVLLGQALDSRPDVTELRERHPELAERFTTLRDELDRAGEDAGPVTTDPELLRRSADTFDAVIAEIRRQPGFSHFLRPPTGSELAAATGDGPVVVVNVSRYGAHALILTRAGVLEPVALPDVTDRVVVDRVGAFLAAVSTPTGRDLGAVGGRTAQRRVTDTLGWLWDAIAGPVLDRLGICGPPAPDHPWPRIWWCASGLLSFLPLHAAGHHGTRLDPRPDTVVDRVVSSYTPTVRALLHARRVTAGAATSDRVVVVAMPHTDDASDLPAARDEAAWLQARFADRVAVLLGATATRAAVLAALPSARWAHFACHAAGHLADPSGGRLLLADHRRRPMTVVDVARLRLDDAELAYLSACATARPGGRLADEAIHLASAFQLAGYRHVIATLWPIGDTDALEVAADIYGALSPAGGDFAAAVHAACHRFRQRWPDTPSVWASHIHSGA